MKNDIIYSERVTLNILRNPMDINPLAHIDYPINELNISIKYDLNKKNNMNITYYNSHIDNWKVYFSSLIIKSIDSYRIVIENLRVRS